MNVKDLVLRNRSYRRFYEDEIIDSETIKELIELGRISPSSKNCQPIKYIISNTEESNNKIFPFTAWAGYLEDWNGPKKGERPSAYIIMLEDKRIASHLNYDQGIAIQSILLGAVEKGLGGCIIGSLKRIELRKALNLDDRYRITNVIALGKPKETIVLEKIKEDGDIKYWRDENQVHHVPKRSLDEIIVEEI